MNCKFNFYWKKKNKRKAFEEVFRAACAICIRHTCCMPICCILATLNLSIWFSGISSHCWISIIPSLRCHFASSLTSTSCAAFFFHPPCSFQEFLSRSLLFSPSAKNKVTSFGLGLKNLSTAALGGVGTQWPLQWSKSCSSEVTFFLLHINLSLSLSQVDQALL